MFVEVHGVLKRSFLTLALPGVIGLGVFPLLWVCRLPWLPRNFLQHTQTMGVIHYGSGKLLESFGLFKNHIGAG